MLTLGLSVVVNSLHMKLAMVIEGHMSPSAIEQWQEQGFLVIFQGLLSVIDKEKSMLEDTVAIVDTLNLFQVFALLIVL